MPTEFEKALEEITGGSTASTPEISQEQAQPAPSESSVFEAALAEKIQDAPADRSQDMPESGGMEH